MLYRGIHYCNQIYFIQNKFENRSPKDTPKEVQTKVDNLLSQAGFSSLRSNSVFCFAS